ncbi:MAG: CRISPR-associated helicase Cas3' [Clostridia bacterium]
MDAYIAHRREADGAEQSILAHLTNTAQRARAFAAAFGAGDAGDRCGRLHDLGKYSAAFQRRIRGSKERTDHATAGAQEAAKLNDLFAAFCIAGHHGGLPDGGYKVDGIDSPTLRGRLKRPLEDYSPWLLEGTRPSAQGCVAVNGFADCFFIRMLFSCLVDADFLDTEQFMRPDGVTRGDYLPLQALLKRLECHVAAWFPPSGALNRMRCDVLRACLEKGADAPGLFKLTVPTGGGKTVSSAAFALRHAVAHQKKRVIYVIPYVSIIEQTVSVFREIFGEAQVVAHYAGTMPSEGDDAVTSSEIARRLATENWDAPIIVTTAVQFFESLFANQTARCRKLHNIVDSVVIFDEAQMLPVPYLRPCLAAIGELVRRYGVTAVLLSATQPALDALLAEFLPEQVALGQVIPELCPNGAEIFAKFRRVRYEALGTISVEALAERLGKAEEVLCIVNRRQDAQDIFARLPPEGAFCLTTLMTPAHRQRTLATIRKRLADGLPCRTVATSLIEAGVDVDFPTVYRAESGLDSLAQAAGRCNRENKRPVETSVVYAFRMEQAAPTMLAQNIAAAKMALEMGGLPDAPETQKAYFEALFRFKGQAALDQKQILPALEGKPNTQLFPFAAVAAAFKLIETDAVTLYIPQGKGAALVEALGQNGPSRDLLRQLGPYGVTCYPAHLKALLATGGAEEIGNGLFALRDERLYSEQIGLTLAGQAGQGFIL